MGKKCIELYGSADDSYSCWWSNYFPYWYVMVDTTTADFKNDGEYPHAIPIEDLQMKPTKNQIETAIVENYNFHLETMGMGREKGLEYVTDRSHNVRYEAYLVTEDDVRDGERIDTAEFLPKSKPIKGSFKLKFLTPYGSFYKINDGEIKSIDWKKERYDEYYVEEDPKNWPQIA